MGSAHHHHQEYGKKSGIKTAFFLNLVFSLIEFTGGLLTNSMAIIADAFHDIGDAAAIGLGWFLQKVSEKGRDKKFSFGYKRFSILGAVINSIVLLVGSVLIVFHSITQISNATQPHTSGMIVLAIAGIIVNGWAVFKLLRSKSLNEQAIKLHLLEDIFGWVAILISAIVMKFIDFPQLDKILSILIAGWVIYNALKNLVKTFKIMLQGIPLDVPVDDLELQLQQINGIKDIHDLHVWSLDGNNHIATLHIEVAENTGNGKKQTIKNKIRQFLSKKHINHVTIEIDNPGDDCTLKDC
ncbi:MAG: cation diffusion facilitator family transporter [Prolixibacteraceae bacterium]|nr:cation diffusion facilitator family transporter [Prolixibacteraceae bacterium]